MIKQLKEDSKSNIAGMKAQRSDDARLASAVSLAWQKRKQCTNYVTKRIIPEETNKGGDDSAVDPTRTTNPTSSDDAFERYLIETTSERKHQKDTAIRSPENVKDEYDNRLLLTAAANRLLEGETNQLPTLPSNTKQHTQQFLSKASSLPTTSPVLRHEASIKTHLVSFPNSDMLNPQFPIVEGTCRTFRTAVCTVLKRP